MKCFWNITSTLLVVFLFLTTGLGGAAHALSNDCVYGHCDEHVTETEKEHHTGHVVEGATDSAPHGSNSMEHDECNPFLCNVLALDLPFSDAVFYWSKAALAWQITSFSALEEPDNPDRPPNL